MRFLIRRLLSILLAALFFWFGTVAADRRLLSECLVGVCVTPASDGELDRVMADNVAAAVGIFLQRCLDAGKEPEAEIGTLRSLVDGIMAAQGSGCSRVVLDREDVSGDAGLSVPLPAGRYRTVRVTLGTGSGAARWACVITEKEGHDVQWLEDRREYTRTVPGRIDFGMRFLLVDLMGRLENLRGNG